MRILSLFALLTGVAAFVFCTNHSENDPSALRCQGAALRREENLKRPGVRSSRPERAHSIRPHRAKSPFITPVGRLMEKCSTARSHAANPRPFH